MIVWPVLSIEEWNIKRPMARTVISPPQGTPLLPDVPNWSWHEYGMRVGFWRLRTLFSAFEVPLTVPLNSSACVHYPQVIEACMESGWELNAHSVQQLPMHLLEDEASSIEASLSQIESFAGIRPRGWFGPGLTETFETIDHLARAGIEYIGDWAFDDEPVRISGADRTLVAIPYTFELHDIVMMALQHHRSAELFHRTKAAFECLYEESSDRPKVMAMAFHPYLSGLPHRIGYVRMVLELIRGHDDVVFWTGGQILDWFTGAQQ